MINLNCFNNTHKKMTQKINTKNRTKDLNSSVIQDINADADELCF